MQSWPNLHFQLNVLKLLDIQGPSKDSSQAAFILQACTKSKSGGKGALVHAGILRNQFSLNVFLANSLINMYANCQRLIDAYQVFDQMHDRDVVTWTTIIVAQIRNKNGYAAVKLFFEMQQERVLPDKFTYTSVLCGCASSELESYGKIIHAQFMISGLQSGVFLASALIRMYIKCGNVNQARLVFERYARNVVAWTTMISGYSEQGDFYEALDLFIHIQQQGVEPNNVTYITILGVCSNVGFAQWGKKIHAELLLKRHTQSYLSIAHAVIGMYSSHGNMEDACQVFCRVNAPEIISCNVLMTGYAKLLDGSKAFNCFIGMKQHGMKPNRITYVNLLNACGGLRSLWIAKLSYAHLMKSGLELDITIGNAVISMYVRCNSMQDSSRVFNTMPMHDIISWNAMLCGCVQHGDSYQTLHLFELMQADDIRPDEVTYVSVLSAYTGKADINRGTHIHVCLLMHGFESNLFVNSALVGMYARCGSFENACMLFNRMPARNVVSWTAMISAYSEQGNLKAVFILFRKMQQDGLNPDEVTYATVLGACTSVGWGKFIHASIDKSSLSLWSCILAMYIQCEDIQHAIKIFDRMPAQDPFSFHALISGYVEHGQTKEAIILFTHMQTCGLNPNKITYGTILGVCSIIGALELGKCFHGYLVDDGMELDSSVWNTLVDMYAKCGSIENCREAFHRMPGKDLISWTAIMSGYSQQGNIKEVLALFEQMQQHGIQPDGVAFLPILSSCSNIGQVSAGYSYFVCMAQHHGLVPRHEHYTCMVDLLGRAGHLQEAKDFIDAMPMLPDTAVWGAFLSACRIYCNSNLAECAILNVKRLALIHDKLPRI